ncbi:MAG: autoinducer binding domain-containing protein, partial [Cytophagales bacterium]|nr:autoinducer binding domain-containing protein [Rhizobacter sp.]
MLHSRYLSVLEAKTSQEFEDEVVRFARRLGFETVTAIVVVDAPRGETKFIDIGYAPAAYRESYEDLRNGSIDPVMQHCRIKSVPII